MRDEDRASDKFDKIRKHRRCGRREGKHIVGDVCKLFRKRGQSDSRIYERGERVEYASFIEEHGADFDDAASVGSKPRRFGIDRRKNRPAVYEAEQFFVIVEKLIRQPHRVWILFPKRSHRGGERLLFSLVEGLRRCGLKREPCSLCRI